MTNMEKSNLNEFTKENEDATIVYNLRKKAIVPIIKDGKIFIYKVRTNDNFNELQKYLETNFVDIYSSLYLNDKKITDDLAKSGYVNRFKEMIDYHQTSKKEFMSYFNLTDEVNKNEFALENAQEKVFRKETFEEVIDRLAPLYVTCTYKRKSKLLVIINYIKYGKCFNLDFIISMINEFITSRKEFNYSKDANKNVIQEEIIKSMKFNNKEKSLAEEEKIDILRTIYDSLDIKCIYSEDLDKVSILELEGIINSQNNDLNDIFIKFAMHNSDILENSEISPILAKIIKDDTLTKKLTHK